MKRLEHLTLPFLILMVTLPSSLLANGPIEDEEASMNQGMGPEAQPMELYRQPITHEPTPKQQTLSCNDLEREISRLQPLTYSYQPGFYEDRYQGAAVTLGSTISPGFYLLSGYINYLGAQSQGRIILAEDKIALLRHLKARQRCFES